MIMLSRRALLGGVPPALAAMAVGARRAMAADVNVVFYDSFAPLSFLDDDHKIVGILPDVVNEIMGRRLQVPVSLQGLPWARAQALVQDGSADAFCTLPTPARRDYAFFTENAVIVEQTQLFYAIDNPRKAEIEAIQTVDQLKGFRQGDYVGNGFAEATFKGLPIELTPTLDSVFKKIAAGHLDLFVGTDIVAMSVVKKLGLGDKIRSFPVAIGAPTPFCVGIRKSLPQAEAMVTRANDAIAAATKDGSLAKIIERYTS